MGYTTVFEGHFNINIALDDETYELLKGLARTRRMKRDPGVLESLGLGEADKLGIEGEFFVESEGQGRDHRCPSIIDHNIPPASQPGLWLQWVPTDDRERLVWDRGEKFYEADAWIIYLIQKILAPRGYVLNGIVNAQGQHKEDKWRIEVKDNVVKVKKGFSKLVKKPDFSKWNEEICLEWEE